ncbi:hypothetical protein QBC47DRAFT_104508 [Echria macrotheca]|uniref:Uncharacterized protein n=1 Tax=Echria macrotheca TaxID=438768 RepID=A0AAJ0F8R9_9PEZI|nr:hypothetical protein QBC47DRAFT_104508 [Echria macrotheca]
MSNGRRRDVSRPPSSDSEKSEDNISVQVNLDASSNRGRFVRRSRRSSRSCSRSKTPGALSRVQTTDNSQSSASSSQNDRRPAEPAEHVLRDLIESTGSSNDALVDILQNLKRPRDGESDDAPQPKRDKLFNELLEMEGTFGEGTSGIATLAASAAARARGTDIGNHTTAGQLPTAIPIRSTRRQQPPRQARAATAAPAATAQNGRPGTSESTIVGEDDTDKPETREP